MSTDDSAVAAAGRASVSRSGSTTSRATCSRAASWRGSCARMRSSASPRTRRSSSRRSRTATPTTQQLRELLPRELSAKELFLELACADVAAGCDLLRPCGSRPAGGTATSRSRSIPLSPTTRLAQYDEASGCTSGSRARTCSSRSRRHRARRGGDRGLDRGGPLDQRHAHLLGRALRRRRARLPRRAHALPRRRRRPLARALGRKLLRLPGRQRDRPPARRARRAREAEGKLGIANAKLAYAYYRELFSPDNELWAELAAAGAHPQRCLWASTSTKNPAYRDVLYVEELIGPETVNTMPEPTLLAFQDHGRVAETLEHGVDEAQRLLEQLAKAGVDYDDVVETLESGGDREVQRSVREAARRTGGQAARTGRGGSAAMTLRLVDLVGRRG